MADAATLSDIIEKVHTISSYADLKRIRLQLLRRERELNINRAAQFKPEAEVCMNSGERRSVFGIVQRVEGANVMVKMAHGFVARIPATKLRLTSTPRTIVPGWRQTCASDGKSVDRRAE